MTARDRSRGAGRRRRILLVAALALAIVLVVTVGAAGVMGVLSSRPSITQESSPEEVLEHYLDALRDGDLEALEEHVDLGDDERARLLLDDPETHPTDGLIDDFSIVRSGELNNGSWQYLVEVEQDGETSHVPLTVTPSGEDGSWEVDRAGLGSIIVQIPSDATALRLNGVEFAREDIGVQGRTYELLVLPGRYTIEAVGASEGQVGAPESRVVGIAPKQLTIVTRFEGA